MKKCIRIYFYPLILSFFISGCTVLLGPDMENTPPNNLKLLWNEFDKKYAQFEVKTIDWDNVYDSYSNQVNDKTTDDDLFTILCDVLTIINDNHVILYREGEIFQSGVLSGKVIKDFSLSLVRESYLINIKTMKEPGFTYGLLTPSIGYLKIDGFSDDKDMLAEKTDKIIEEFQSLNSIIIDIRNNGGGSDIGAFTIASRFADQKRGALKTKYRNGPLHNDFGSEKIWYLEPGGDKQFTKEIIVLTHLFTVSAAENFTLAMRTLPHVVHMGSTTSGAFANTVTCELLNGWTYVIPIGLFRTIDNICYEGIGITPDVIITNTEADINAGRDLVLEAAISAL